MCAVVILAASVRIAHGFAPSVSILPSSSSAAAAASVGSSGRRQRHPPPAHHHGNDDDRVDDRIRRRGRCGDPSSSSDDDDDDAAVVASRDRRFLVSSAASAMATSVLPLVAIVTTTTFAVAPPPSNALVKGNAPPPKRRPAADDGGGGGGEQQGQQPPRCRNVEECQETAEREGTLRAQREAAMAASGPKPRIAPGGTKYLDVVDEAGSPPAAVTATATAAVAKMGDVADVHYRVLKIGKRSYDGLSGEGTVVFSRGYALEDDERVIGDRSFRFAIGDDRVIKGEFPRPSSSADGAPGGVARVFFAHRPPTMCPYFAPSW
jgi:hypothetical protein